MICQRVGAHWLMVALFECQLANVVIVVKMTSSIECGDFDNFTFISYNYL
jgi:hypothetical protein